VLFTVERLGLAHVGDSILEVNGVEVKSPDDLKKQLAQAEVITLKLVSSGLESSPVLAGVRLIFIFFNII